MLREIQTLLDSSWTYARIARRLQTDVSTIYRWREAGTSPENVKRLRDLMFMAPPQRGIYYLQIVGLPWVFIGETRDVVREIEDRQPYVPSSVRLVAWYPGEELVLHLFQWKAHNRGKGEWFQYHPDMEQKGDTPVV